MSSYDNTIINYGLLAVNAGIIGSIFIFFALAAQIPTSTVFSLVSQRCSFGFNIQAEQAQLAVAIVGGILIIPFSMSSMLILMHNNRLAGMITSIGFALMIVSAAIILFSLACMMPFA